MTISILFIGQTARGQTSGMRAQALRRLGHDVHTVDSGMLWRSASYLQRSVEQRRGTGVRIDAFNDAVHQALRQFRPDLLWAEKQEHLDPSLLQLAHNQGVQTVHYNPDPYFAIQWKRTARGDACLRLYDVAVVTKRYELDDYLLHGVQRVIYSPLGFDPVVHTPTRINQRSGADVVFVGGWEPRRERLIAEAARITTNVRVWGYGWRIAQMHQLNLLRALRLGRLTPGERLYWGAPRGALGPLIGHGEGPHGEIYAEAYASAIGGSRVSLGFLRELCPDEHTTRTFELPAMGGFLLADRSEEHCELFDEGREAEFFGTDDEFSEKLSYYLTHETARVHIARAGRERCLASGYSYDERLRTILAKIDAGRAAARAPTFVRR